MDNFCYFCTNKINGGGQCSVCGRHNSSCNVSPHHIRPGTVLNGKYAIGAVIGEGGFGITYIGRDLTLDMPVAVKEYFPFGMVTRNNDSSEQVTANTGASGTNFPKGRQSFLNEARSLARFADEPCCVSVRDFFEANNTAYIVMEYLRGETLKDYIEKNGAMPYEKALQIIIPVMTLLNKMHSQGIIHRDISPSNIMLLENGKVKLLDFGATRVFDNTDERSLSVMLKPGFAPEEQYRSRGNQGPWTDVYALAATMYKMLTGITPDDAMNRMYSDELRPIREINSSVPEPLDAVIRKGMEIFGENRYQTVNDFKKALADSLRVKPSVQNQPVMAAAAEKTVSGEELTSQPYGEKTVSGEELTSQPYGERTVSGEELTSQPYGEKTVSGEELTSQPYGEKTVSGEMLDSQAVPPPGYVPPAPDESESEKKKKKKKPSIPCLIGSVLSLIMTTMAALGSESEYGEINGFAIGVAVVFGILTIFLASKFFPRIDKTKKPNKVCMVLSVITALSGIASFIHAITAEDLYDSSRHSYIIMTVFFLVLTVLFSWMYYPRLTKKKKRLAGGLYTGALAATAAYFIFSATFTALGTENIGDKVFPLDAEKISITADIMPDHDIEKLKQFNNLKELYIRGSFMDDDDVKIISECCPGLIHLELGQNTDIKDISPLANLKNLKNLALADTDVKDVSPLAELKNLEMLALQNTCVEDISCLTDLKKLTWLSVSETEVTDLSCLAEFPELRDLHISNLEKLDPSTIRVPASLESISASGSGIEDISFLSVCENLSKVDLTKNNITDISALSGCSNLFEVNVSYNYITDISPALQTGIYWLKANYNEIEDISAVEACSEIFDFEVSHNHISDISALHDNNRISELHIDYNNISDISALHECFNIRHLYISANQISDISVLEFIDELTTIEAYDNKISDISVLSKCSKVENLSLSGNQIKDISALSACTNLKKLYLNRNQISDLTPIDSCTNIADLYFYNNNVTDISFLADNKALSTVYAPGNPIKDIDRILNTEEPFSYDPSSSLKPRLAFDYIEGANWQKLHDDGKLTVIIFNTDPRKQKELKGYGFGSFNFGDIDGVIALEKMQEETSDLRVYSEEETTEGDEENYE